MQSALHFIRFRRKMPMLALSVARSSNGRTSPSGGEYLGSSPSLAISMYILYILECADNSLYTGITTDIDRRFLEHKNKMGGRYTRAKKVVRIAYSENYPNRSSASKREAEIKGWSRQEKLDLIRLGRMVSKRKN